MARHPRDGKGFEVVLWTIILGALLLILFSKIQKV
jgi:hypothetical protein